MDLTIETPRLRLTRLTNTDIDSEHLKWFHECWTDEVITAWSVHGKTSTLESSREWMITQLNSYKIILYAIHIKPSDSSPPNSTPETNPSRVSSIGTLIGNCGLRIQDNTEYFPTPPRNPHLLVSSSKEETPIPPKDISSRTLGYALFESAWGKGYATEAVSALMTAFQSLQSATRKKAKEREEEEVWTYVKAVVDYENSASRRVMEKLGFENLGKVVVGGDKMFLGGQWRNPIIWTYGKWI